MVIDIGGTFQYVTTDVGGYGEGLLTKPLVWRSNE